MSEAIGEIAEKRIQDQAAEAMREAIEEVGGREVFFAGTLGEDGRVEDVRVCARGTEGAVPALFEGLKTRQVVIHNHPSGEIAPSDADLQLASIFSFQGHGVYIVDNAVGRVYAVVEPLPDGEGYRLDLEQLATHFGAEGALAQKLPSFELRPQQEQMMRLAGRAFNENGIAVIEAPTGVGKTMAYLLPAVQWAVNNGERVVISTRTINLQEQIIHKDIPALADCLGVKVNAVLVKGRGNYLCLRKFHRIQSEATLFQDEKDQDVLKALAEWAKRTEDGSTSDLPFVPPRDLWSQICSESDTCRIGNCPDPQKCFIGKARRDVAKADILVVNHHMLFSDLAIKLETGNFSSLAVLPAYKRVILDEAHSVEDSATQYFGMEATQVGAMALIGRFVRSERGRERGLLPYIKERLIRERIGGDDRAIEEILDLINNDLLPFMASVRSALQAAFESLRNVTADRCGQIGRDIKWRLTDEALQDPDLREVHQVYVIPAAEECVRTAQLCTGLAQRLRKLPRPKEEGAEPPLLSEILQVEAYRDRLQRLAVNLPEATSEKLQANTVRWIEIDAKNPRVVRVVRCPLHVGEALAESLYGNIKTVVMTSATLSVRQQFDYLFQRLGLDRVAERHLETAMLPTPFDFQAQALLGVITDMPDPASKAYLDAVTEAVREILEITRGHAFVLFTSFYALDYVHKRLAEPLRAAGIQPLRQGEAARTLLLERFRNDPASVLFGTDSFWEGVDVAGEALQCVILAKLPFRVPTEPIQEARAEALEEAGGNAFMGYTVPQAVIKFRQGFGRLIRRRTDRGAIIVLDHRVVTKHYGKIFLESLPGMRILKAPKESIYKDLDRFFNEGGRS